MNLKDVCEFLSDSGADTVKFSIEDSTRALLTRATLGNSVCEYRVSLVEIERTAIPESLCNSLTKSLRSELQKSRAMTDRQEVRGVHSD